MTPDISCPRCGAAYEQREAGAVIRWECAECQPETLRERIGRALC
jgi:transposase-like protein